MKATPLRLRNPCIFATLAVALVWLAPQASAEPASTEPASATAASSSGLSAKQLAFPEESQLEPLRWTALEGWQQDDHVAAFATFRASCDPLARRLKWLQRKNRSPRDSRPMKKALMEVCTRAMTLENPDPAAARAFFEENFWPVKVGKLGEETGLLTGYYEPIIQGSRFPSDEYTVPVYRTPPDLVARGRRTANGGFPNKGFVGRRVGSKLVPYHERTEIEEGVLAGNGLEICWVKDPVDAFFMQIQGSARVKLDTGKTLRLNYAAHNGHPYTPVGRILIQRNEVTKEQMSMERIRQWMDNNPDGGKDLRRANKSYVFMRETGLANDVEPTGAQGVPLTPGRSIAVDKKLHVYGTPFFISAELPIESERPETPFRRLMVAQDTGSAIVGVARADIYFGAGEEAGKIGGRIKQQGRFVMLMPKSIDPDLMNTKIPLPPPRPHHPDDPVLVATAASGVFNVRDDRTKEAPAGLAYAPANAPVNVPVPRPAAAKAEYEQAADAVPLPLSRPSVAEQISHVQNHLPQWLVSVMPISQAEAAPLVPLKTRTFASVESAISAAVAAPAAFAAPAVTQAAATDAMIRKMVRVLGVPLPRARPQGKTPVKR
jgi:peptidoglycan lytic transglycosylase A